LGQVLLLFDGIKLLFLPTSAGFSN